MMNRRDFLRAAGLLALAPTGCSRQEPPGLNTESMAPAQAAPGGLVLNDIHSQLNSTRVATVAPIQSLDELVSQVHKAAKEDKAISVAGGRHSMGGQQFGTGTVHLDTRPMKRVLGFDSTTGIIEVEAGIQWPDLIDWYLSEQKDGPNNWGIAQKQTGADRLALGGALSANAHGRGLTLKPIIGDVESFTLVNAKAEVQTCSRSENPELFRLAIGGYGLFGVIYSVRLRLKKRQKLERVVEVRSAEGIAQAFQQRINDGFLYGDFQFETDETSQTFLTRGVFPCYRPVAFETPVPGNQKELGYEDWVNFLHSAHADKAEAFRRYASYYTSTSGQIYWADTQQLSIYPDYYHRDLDERLGAKVPGTEMITEVYVPRSELDGFLMEAARVLRQMKANVIYGTVRLIERDDESFLAWAKKPYACIVMNLHVEHDPGGIEHAKRCFRMLIDLGRGRGGNYFLTYHKWATKEQVLDCYPQFPEFLALKRKYDPKERFQSDWYRHHRKMLS